MSKVLPVAAILLVFNFGCSRSHPNVGGETNWLRSCTSAKQCDEGLTCLCGLCSVECELNKDCHGLGASAVCADMSATSVAPACEAETAENEGALCVLPCRKDKDCTIPSGVSSICYSGYCVQENHAAVAAGSSTDGGTPPDAAQDSRTPLDASEDSAVPIGVLGQPCDSDGNCRGALECNAFWICEMPSDSGTGADTSAGNGRDGSADRDASAGDGRDGSADRDASAGDGRDGSADSGADARPACDEENPCGNDLVCHIDNTCIEPGVLDENGFATLAVVPGQIEYIAVDDTHVYWTERGTEDMLGNYQGDGKVASMPIEGGPVTTIAESQSWPRGLLVDDGTAYWLERIGADWPASYRIVRAPKDGSSAPSILQENINYDFEFAQDDTHLYFLTWDLGACRVRKDGAGEVEQMAPDLVVEDRITQPVDSLLSDGEYVYLTYDAEDEYAGPETFFLYISKDSLERAELVAIEAVQAGWLLFDKDEDYLYCAGGESSEVRKIPKIDGGNSIIILPGESPYSIRGVKVYDGYIYFYRHSFGQIEIGRAPVNPGESEVIISLDASEHEAGPSVDLEVTDKGLFWSQFLDAIPANRVTRFQID